MYCYTILLKVHSIKMNYSATLIEKVKSESLTKIIEIYKETVNDAIADTDFVVISTSLQESLKD